MDKTFQNPIFEPVFADPTVIKGNDGFVYMYATEDDWDDCLGPHLIPIIRTNNFINWEYVGDALSSRPNWGPENTGIWAPDISKKGDSYFLFYSISKWGDHRIPGIGVATSEHPSGPFTDHGPVVKSKDIGVWNSIDPMHFIEDDGSSFLIWGSFDGIYGIPLSIDSLKTAGDKFRLAGDAYEAAYIMKRHGYYYLLASKGTCCDGEHSTYHVCVGRSTDLKGPYLDQEGKDLLNNGGTPILLGLNHLEKGQQRFAGPGHHTVFTDDEGKDWILYHAIDVDQPVYSNGITRRPMLMDQLVWEHGWPTVSHQQPSISPKIPPKIAES